MTQTSEQEKEISFFSKNKTPVQLERWGQRERSENTKGRAYVHLQYQMYNAPKVTVCLCYHCTRNYMLCDVK